MSLVPQVGEEVNTDYGQGTVEQKRVTDYVVRLTSWKLANGHSPLAYIQKSLVRKTRWVIATSASYTVASKSHAAKIESIKEIVFSSPSAVSSLLIKVPKGKIVKLEAKIISHYQTVEFSSIIAGPSSSLTPHQRQILHRIPTIYLTGGGKVILKLTSQGHTRPQFNIVQFNCQVYLWNNLLVPYYIINSFNGLVLKPPITEEDFRKKVFQENEVESIEFFTHATIGGDGFRYLGSFYSIDEKNLSLSRESVRYLFDRDNTVEIENMRKSIEATSRSKPFLLCGSGFSMLISDKAETWAGFLRNYITVSFHMINQSRRIEEFHARINSGDDLTTIADEVAELMNHNGATNHRIPSQFLFREWTVSNLRPAQVLKSLNCTVLTTNYDQLIEQSLTPPDVVRTPTLLQSTFTSMSHTEAMGMRGDWLMNNWLLDGAALAPDGDFFLGLKHRCLIHLHGTYHDIDSHRGFCLTADEYEDPRITQEFLNFMIPIATNRSLIFAGCGGTLSDPHFLLLWQAISGCQLPHYILYRVDRESEALLGTILEINVRHQINLIGVKYGALYWQLVDFLASLTI